MSKIRSFLEVSLLIIVILVGLSFLGLNPIGFWFTKVEPRIESVVWSISSYIKSASKSLAYSSKSITLPLPTFPVDLAVVKSYMQSPDSLIVVLRVSSNARTDTTKRYSVALENDGFTFDPSVMRGKELPMILMGDIVISIAQRTSVYRDIQVAQSELDDAEVNLTRVVSTASGLSMDAWLRRREGAEARVKTAQRAYNVALSRTVFGVDLGLTLADIAPYLSVTVLGER